MNRLLQIIYPWESPEKAANKVNTEVASFLLYNFTLFFQFLVIFLISKVLFLPMKQAEISQRGYEGGIIRTLEVFATNFWLSLLLFLLTMVISVAFSLVLIRLNPKYIPELVSQISYDVKMIEEEIKFKVIIKDILVILKASFLLFLVVEILTQAGSMIVLSLSLFIIFATNSWVVPIYVSLLISQLVLFPTFLFFYNKYILRKHTITKRPDYRDFFNESGEVDFEKWKKQSWMGNRGYNWKEEKYEPIICPSCASIISSNLTECPICNADLLEEIEKLLSGEDQIENEEKLQELLQSRELEDEKLEDEELEDEELEDEELEDEELEDEELEDEELEDEELEDEELEEE